MEHHPRARSRSIRAVAGAALVAALVGLGLNVVPVAAAHPEASLAGSNFEIDTDANLKVDDPGSVDWASIVEPEERRAVDAATGQDDDSYKGGVKEDTECPGETTGSIPNNKSDLLTFHVNTEPGTGDHPGFLNLAWSRVSEPSGTTLMDFEFNQSETPCPDGPNVLRTEGDLLLEYAIDQGGSRADISVRTWTGTAWGAPMDLDMPSDTCGGEPCAAGTINSSPIPASESDGLGDKDARTFGEAQLDLRLIFQPNKCVSFGSAMLKSRSSDSFTSQLKDFIRPLGIDLTNCGRVVIHKVTDPSDPGPQFSFTKSFATDPVNGDTFQLGDGGTKSFSGVLFGSGYTVTEDDPPAGWDFVGVDCSASVGVTPSILGATVTFDIDDEDDILECTYTNRARGTIVVEKITDDGAGSFEFTSLTLPTSPFTLTTTAAGEAGKDAETFADLAPGTYDVDENVPDGWSLVSAACSDGSPVSAILLEAGETVTCTFHDERERGAIEITKTRKHAADGPGDHPHAGVTFTVTGGELPPEGVTVVTDALGSACVDDLVVSSFFADGYTVTETLPAGYAADGDLAKTVSVVESTCDDGNAASVSFANTPLTDLTVTVDSQVDGGTASTIECAVAGSDPPVVVASGATGPTGDGSASVSGLLPGTYVCTVVIDP
jgi:hypothetical protein